MPRFLVALALLMPTAAQAAMPRTGTEIGSSRPFGLGLVLGAPSGVTGKVYFDPSHALEFTAAAWASSRFGWDGYYAHVVYLWHPSLLTRQSGFLLSWHVGVGGFVTDGGGLGWDPDYDWTHGGVRGVVGLDLDLTRAPFQFFADLGLNASVLPGFWGDGTLGVGARYYF